METKAVRFLWVIVAAGAFVWHCGGGATEATVGDSGGTGMGDVGTITDASGHDAGDLDGGADAGVDVGGDAAFADGADAEADANGGGGDSATDSGTGDGGVTGDGGTAAPAWIHSGIIYLTHPFYYYDGIDMAQSLNHMNAHLGDLPALGVKTLVIGPVFKDVSGTNPTFRAAVDNRYGIMDHGTINTHWGSTNELATVVDAVHALGMRALFDVSMELTPLGSYISAQDNHNWIAHRSLTELQGIFGAANVKTLDCDTESCAYYDSNGTFAANCVGSPTICSIPSKRIEFYGRLLNGTVYLRHYWQPAWGFAPDYTNQNFIDYMAATLTNHVKNYGLDGYRIDTITTNVNPAIAPLGTYNARNLLAGIQQAMQTVNPDAILYGEECSSSGNRQLPDLDYVTDMSYSYEYSIGFVGMAMTPVPRIDPTRNGKDLEDFLDYEVIWSGRTRSRFIEWSSSGYGSTGRIMDPSSGYRSGVLPLSVITCTIPGVPMIVAGEEIGAGEDGKSPVFGAVEWNNVDQKIHDFFKTLGTIRNGNPAFTDPNGTFSNVFGSGSSIYAFERASDSSKVLVAANGLSTASITNLNLSFAAGTVLHDRLGGNPDVTVANGSTAVSLPGYGYAIYSPAPRP